MNRICFEIDANGDLVSVASDEPVEVYIVNPKTPADRVYLYGADIGPHHVQKLIGGYAVGHKDDGIFGGSGSHLPPSKVVLKVVE